MKLLKRTLIATALLTASVAYASDESTENKTTPQTTFEQVGQTRAFMDGPYGGVGGGAPIRINFRPNRPQVDRTNMQNGTKLGTKPITQNHKTDNKGGKNNTNNNNTDKDTNKDTDKDKDKDIKLCGRCLA